jgi:hypothetical protein
MDSSALTAPVNSLTVKENQVAAHSERAPETSFTGGERIWQPKQPLVTHKHSRKTVSLPPQKLPSKLFSHATNGFVSPHSPVDS